VTRPYVDRPITDAVAADQAAVIAAEYWNLGEPALVRVGMNAILACGDTVLRVGHPTTDAHASIELARVLLAAGLRVPAPRRADVVVVSDLSVTCWERIATTSTPIDWRAVGEMIRRVHELRETDIPSVYPVPAAASFPWWDFATLLEQTRSWTTLRWRESKPPSTEAPDGNDSTAPSCVTAMFIPEMS
jgi:hypothetical protein